MFAVSGLAALLFLGGWHSGFLPFEPRETLGPWLGTAVNLLVFVGKGSLLIVVMMWLRWSLPRLRIDQVMMVCLKYFLPISCGLLIGVCVWELYLPRSAAKGVTYVLTGGTLLFGLGVLASVLRSNQFAPSIRVGGAWQLPVAKGGA
jgi:NADH-quinone oxidoreductase subunit H